MENPIKMDDLGVPLFLDIPTWPCLMAEQGRIHQYLATMGWKQNGNAIRDVFFHPQVTVISLAGYLLSQWLTF